MVDCSIWLNPEVRERPRGGGSTVMEKIVEMCERKRGSQKNTTIHQNNGENYLSSSLKES